MKLVIIGAVAGGASAAARARRLDEDAEIVLVERGADPSFANCGMPYYIGGEIAERGKLLVAPKSLLERRLRLDVRTRSEALAIDRQAKIVRIRELESGREYDESYDKLILSPGAKPRPLPCPGADLPGVYALRDLADADRLKDAASQAAAALIVGAGFIGVEVAENLVRLGVRTTIVELADQVLPPWDKEMTAPIAAALREKEVALRLEDVVESIEASNSRLRAKFRAGDASEFDLVLACIGVVPENQLAADAGLELGSRGGIRVNDRMETNDPDIFAVGDVVETQSAQTGEPTMIPLAGPANRQGRIAADNCFGRDSRYRGTQGTSIVGLFGRSAGLTGLGEKALQRAGTPYDFVVVHPSHHAGYYPGAEQLTLKVLFDPESGKLLGAQAVGGAGVDKRIDVLATAIQAGMTVYDLEEAELAYAPQFGSAKDPVNMAGFVAAGRLRGDHPGVSVPQLHEQLSGDGKPFLLDVRSSAEFERGAIPGAVNIPIEELRERLDETPSDRPIVAYCQVGIRGYLATRLLGQRGRRAANLSGGYKSYTQARDSGVV